MNDKIQLKRGTLENWLNADPILMDGEMALVATNPATPTVYDQYKVGGGSKKFSELPYQGLPCLQGLGDSTTSPLSQKAITDWINKGYQFRGIATPSTNPGTPDGPVFYLATEAGTYANFNGISVADGEAVILLWNDGAWTKKTTGLATEQEIIYDVSARNDGAVFESLQALLSSSDLNTLIPTSVRHGGMSIRFIQGSVSNSDNNKYVQWRYMGTEIIGTPNPFLDTANWQGVDDEPTAGSDNLVKSGGVATALNKVSEISKEEPYGTDDFIVVEDDEGNTVVEITPDFVNAKNLKSNGFNVLTEEELPLTDLSHEDVSDTDESISFTNEEETDTYVSINQNGIKAKDFFDMDGKSIFVKKNTSGTLAVEEPTLADGEAIEISNTPNTKNYKSLSFHADIVTMGTLTIHHGNGQYYCGKVSVDGTNIYPFNRLAVQQTAIPHGLTFTDFVDIDVDIADDINGAKLNINTNGGQYSCDIPWGGANGKATVKNSGGSYTNCFFTFGGRAFLKNVWIFGDSYVDFWQPELDIMGYKEFLADGYSGRQSAGAYQSLVNALKIGYPSTVVWMLGMNDGDNGSINANYKENIDKVVTLCNSLNINLIVSTIPNTPKVTNSYKNVYIRGIEGIRILDVAKCVGADSAGSSWYSGLLGSDNIHPSSNGATVIAKFMSNELPIIK